MQTHTHTHTLPQGKSMDLANTEGFSLRFVLFFYLSVITYNKYGDKYFS